MLPGRGYREPIHRSIKRVSVLTRRTTQKGTAVLPDSPDCGLSPNNPGRDGTRSSRRLFAYSPEPKVEKVD